MERKLAAVTVPVAVMFAAEISPEIRALPWTDNFCDGDVVLIPTDPASVAR